MRVKFIDYPTFIEVSKYDELKNKLVNQLISHPSILSVYQMGSVKTPGISDLDLICVFHNDSECNLNLRGDLSNDEKKILTHGIFGVEEQDLTTAMTYNLLSNLQLLGGKDLSLGNVLTTKDQGLKTQIALEYLLKMYIALDTQTTLKISKLRSFLLLGKAISFDLELLNIKDGELHDLVKRVFDYRAIWFENQPKEKEVLNLVLNFHKEIEKLLSNLLIEHKFYLPFEEIYMPGNFSVKKGERLKRVHKGIVLPNQLKFFGKKYINLQYRLNKFEYELPFEVPQEGTIISDRFEFTKKLVLKSRKRFPSFVPIMSSLSMYNNYTDEKS
ncbi:hypothetical protein [Psychroserpens sp.]|uniref:hypothetical protein n=1 Tax=Psychroserpens sp. TaxID=2020870 RepID=UPI002B268CDF|nr:hypothetical protein [Psychroserpens sp.]